MPLALASRSGPNLATPTDSPKRYYADDHHWRHYWPDRNGRWHAYDMREPTIQVAELLREIDADPTGIFWG